MPANPGVWVREITGYEELSLQDTNTYNGIRLINSLLIKNGHEPPRAEQITTADRDRIFSAVYRSHFGAKIEGLLTCPACSKKFELNFILRDLEEHLQFNPHDPGHPDQPFFINEQCSFRLPTGEDELAITGLPPTVAARELLRRCVIQGDAEMNKEKIEERMAGIAPVLQTDLDTHCAECGTEQRIRFDMQSYFLTRLKQEQAAAIRQVHRLAAVYKWSHQEILGLPVRLRRQYVKLIASEMESSYER